MSRKSPFRPPVGLGQKVLQAFSRASQTSHFSCTPAVWSRALAGLTDCRTREHQDRIFAMPPMPGYVRGRASSLGSGAEQPGAERHVARRSAGDEVPMVDAGSNAPVPHSFTKPQLMATPSQPDGRPAKLLTSSQVPNAAATETIALAAFE